MFFEKSVPDLLEGSLQSYVSSQWFECVIQFSIESDRTAPAGLDHKH